MRPLPLVVGTGLRVTALWALGAAVLLTWVAPASVQAGDSARGWWLSNLWREFEVSRQLLDPWVWFGFGAQSLFFLRFFWQWLVSERRHRSTIPVAFWYLSLAGGFSLFVYACHNRDLVIMSGQLLACLIYVRNLMLIHGWQARRRRAGLPPEKLESAVNGEDPAQPGSFGQ